MIIFEAVLNRLRGTGVIKHFGTLKIFNKEIQISFVGNHLYGLWIALVLGVATTNTLLGLAVLVAYFIGEAKGWGEWVGSLSRVEPWDEELLQYCYKDNEGKTFPFIHQIANSVYKEQIEGTFEQRAKQYKKYTTLAIMLRGFWWWSLIYFTLAIFGAISYELALGISLSLATAFPIACEIGRRWDFTNTYDLKLIKLNFSQGWENQEVIYGMFQGIALWYVVLKNLV